MNTEVYPSFGRRYANIKSLGSGAQGVVFTGEDKFLGGAKVTIKALRPRVDRDWITAFRHEFEVLAGFSHPRLARVHDFGFTGDHLHYFTRDYVEGEDLEVAASRMDDKSCLNAFVEICRSLKPLHRRGLLHGDLKPGNIILSRDKTAHLIDFSFVCARGEDAKRQGTVQYMAPEVIEGQPVDTRADLYSLGITMVTVLFGKPLFEGSVSEIIKGHLGNSRPHLLSNNSRLKGTESNSILEGMIQIASKLISQKPQNRFPDVWEVEAALTALRPEAVMKDPLPDYPAISDPMGRDAEIARIREGIERRFANPKESPVLKVVLGEFGTGKAAVQRSVKWWAQLCGVAVVEARSASGILEPIAELVNQALDHLQSDTVAVAMGEHLVEKLSKPSATSTNIDGLTQETARLLADVAKKKRLLIEISDLERASKETIRILSGLLATIELSSPTVVLAAAEPSFSWREKLGQGDVFTLPVLQTNEISRLALSFLGRAEPRLIERVKAHTGGNPLFVHALLSDLVAQGEGIEQLEKLGPPRQLEAYWRDRLSTMTSRDRTVLEATAVIDRLASLEELIHVTQIDRDLLKQTAVFLETSGWLRKSSFGWHVATAPLAREIISSADNSSLALYHQKAIDIEPNEAKKLLHAARGNRVDLVKARGLAVAESLENIGALQAALELCSEMDRVFEGEKTHTSVKLLLGRIHLAQGSYEEAKRYLLPLIGQENGRVHFQALLLLGTIHSHFGDLEESSACLQRVLDDRGAPSDIACAYKELSNVEFKRGNTEACVLFAEKGLAHAPERDIVRADLLIVLAKEAAHKGRHEDAISRAREAVLEARLTGDKYSSALAVEMLAWVLGQSGDLLGSIRELERAKTLYQEIGNLTKLMRNQLALGDMKWRMENWCEALEHYEEACKLTAAVSNPLDALLSEIGLGQALVKVGRFERAMLVIDRAVGEAGRLGQEELRLQTLVYRAELLASKGDIKEALDIYREAHAGFESLLKKLSKRQQGSRIDEEKVGWMRQQDALAEIELDIADWLIWRGNPKDWEEAKTNVETAAKRNREDRGRLFDEHLLLVTSALSIATGDIETGIDQLDNLLKKQQDSKVKDLRWRAHLIAAKGHLKQNADLLARKRLRQSQENLDILAENFSDEQRMSFWQDVRRAEVRRLLEITVPSSDLSSSITIAQSGKDIDKEAKALYRVLEINKQLSIEPDLNHLLEAILDAAVDLTGAECGLVLMASTDNDKKLEIRAAKRIDGSDLSNLYERFSKSIAESVYLDGEPVVIIDAMGDERFKEYLSIHEMRLKSVLCVPVRYRKESLGVLYMENRFKSGRFHGQDLRVLSAFSDQVAIAISQAKLIEEAKKRETELKEARLAIEEAYHRQTENLNSHKTDLKLAKERLDRLHKHINGQGHYHGAIGTSREMGRVFSLMERVKDLDVPVVFVGESGTGKDLLGRILHEESSRKDGPFVVMNCGAVPETLMESALFGHKKGAFSGAFSDNPGVLAAARGGSLYLDEIGDMPLRMQVDLLRVLQDSSFTPLGALEIQKADFRLIVSSKIPLKDLEKSGCLRKDLLYRLEVVTVEIPPLRMRKEDILPLARRMIDREAAQSTRPSRPLSKEAADSLLNYDWPGNVRQLEQLVRRVIIVGENSGPISSMELGLDTEETHGTLVRDSKRTSFGANQETARILEALERCQWNRTRAAQELGIPRRTFYRKMEKLGIEVKR